MIKILITFLVWTGGFLLMKPDNKPTWMAVVASVATFQVLLFFIEAVYRSVLEVLELIEKFLRDPKE